MGLRVGFGTCSVLSRAASPQFETGSTSVAHVRTQPGAMKKSLPQGAAGRVEEEDFGPAPLLLRAAQSPLTSVSSPCTSLTAASRS